MIVILTFFVFFFMFKTALWIGISTPIARIAVAFALIKYNGRPLPYLALSVMRFIWQPRFYLWERRVQAAPVPHVAIPKLKPRPAPRHRPASVIQPASPVIKKTPAPASAFAKATADKPACQEKKSLLGLLGFKLASYTNPIPRREPIPKPTVVAQPSESNVLLRRLMKERELARRVDYR